MPALCIARPPDSLFGGADWTSLGLVSCIIGAFLIANSTLFEHPRSLVGRHFGRSAERLQSVREYVYNRVQTTLGFAFLLAGFGFQLIGRFREMVPEGSGAAEPPLSMAWVGVIVASAIVLLFSGWWWSVWAFRRYVREYFSENPRDFMAEPAVAREVGELFGIESSQDDTVEDYVERLVSETGLPHIGGQRTLQTPGTPGSLGAPGVLGATGALGALARTGEPGSLSHLTGDIAGSGLRGALQPGTASGGATPGVGGFAGASILPDDFE